MKLSYIQKGSGKDLVMLHGYLATKESFYPQIEYFSRFYRVTALDFPGFGQAEELTGPYSVGDYADWLTRALKELEIESPFVIAHSFGGRVAVKCLSRGNCFERTVLTGCAGIIPKRTLKYKLRVKTYRLVKKFAPRYAERKFGSSEYRSLSPVMRESYKKIVNEDLREDAKKIAVPVLFIVGDQDTETPVKSAEIYHACVSGSRLKVMANCGHFAHLDDALHFNLAAEEFFK
ncbi:MAG: alpha/beta hydrolase [Clostridia bacterium]|nr:alpha/beta hydrolase [Clostridia bacterium]